MNIYARRALGALMKDGSGALRYNYLVAETAGGTKRVLSDVTKSVYDGTVATPEVDPPYLQVLASMDAPATETYGKVYACGSRGATYCESATELETRIASATATDFTDVVLDEWDIPVEDQAEYEEDQPVVVRARVLLTEVV